MFLCPGNSTCVTDIGRSVSVSRKLGRVGRSGQPLFGERPSNVVNLCSVPETRAELRGGHHALGRHLPYMATHPTRLREMCMREIAISWGGHPTRLREICTREIAISWGGTLQSGRIIMSESYNPCYAGCLHPDPVPRFRATRPQPVCEDADQGQGQERPGDVWAHALLRGRPGLYVVPATPRHDQPLS